MTAHVAVHQDEVVFLLVECLQGLIAMHNHIGMTPQLTKHDGRHKTVGFIVLGDEPKSLQPLGLASGLCWESVPTCREGSAMPSEAVNQKVLPAPTLLTGRWSAHHFYKLA
jgi:hypothetical protein